jgi:hypothetical protein
MYCGSNVEEIRIQGKSITQPVHKEFQIRSAEEESVARSARRLRSSDTNSTNWFYHGWTQMSTDGQGIGVGVKARLAWLRILTANQANDSVRREKRQRVAAVQDAGAKAMRFHTSERVMECAGRAQRRRRFGKNAAMAGGAKAVSRFACHRTPKHAGARFGRARRSAASPPRRSWTAATARPAKIGLTGIYTGYIFVAWFREPEFGAWSWLRPKRQDWRPRQPTGPPQPWKQADAGLVTPSHALKIVKNRTNELQGVARRTRRREVRSGSIGQRRRYGAREVRRGDLKLEISDLKRLRTETFNIQRPTSNGGGSCLRYASARRGAEDCPPYHRMAREGMFAAMRRVTAKPVH